MNQVHCLPALTDNFIFGFGLGNDLFVVDPGEAKPVYKWLEQQILPKQSSDEKSLHILLTHKHADHVGGTTDLVGWWQDRFPGFPISIVSSRATAAQIPPVASIFANLWQFIEPSDQETSCDDGVPVTVGQQQFLAFSTPGHTLDHIAYYNSELQALFSGDVLFGFGCGRLFEGSPEMMMRTLAKLSRLPSATRVFFAHEYTEKNFQFSEKHLNLEDLKTARLELDHRWQKNGKTVPSTIGFESAYNPFLRERDLTRWTRLRSDRNSF